MTQIALTYPEPRGDIAAQMVAVVDHSHPKRALWVSLGTQTPAKFDDLPSVAMPAGRLYAAPRLLRRFKGEPTLEVLAEILDYVECKSGIMEHELTPVVQAVTHAGWVVQEMATSWDHLNEAWSRVSRYGRPRILSMAECLMRRRDLLAAEGWNGAFQ